MNKKQAEAVAEALLSPAREAQEAAQRSKQERRLKLATQRRAASFGLAGAIVGGAIGYWLDGKIFPACLVGMAIGFVLGYFIARRAS